MSQRIGQGWDIHALVPGRRLVLGGVEVPHSTGLLGHSDADVLAHAIVDALLGAAGLGDIGTMFPDTDEKHRDADSLHLLSLAAARVRELGLEIENIDSTLIAQAPRLASYLPRMVIRLAKALALEESRINVKAKTAEKLGPVGQGLAIEAQAVVLLTRST